MCGKTTPVALLALAFAALPGCARVSLSEVQSFGSAADSLAESGLDAYGLLNEAATAQLITDLSSLPPATPAEAAASWKRFDGVVIDGLVPAEKLESRMALLAMLGNYGSALGSLASADVAGELEEASSAYFSAVVSLNQSVADIAAMDPVISKDTIKGVGQAISTVGGLALEARQRKLVIQLVIDADPAVQAAAALVAKDLDPKADLAVSTDQLLANRIALLKGVYFGEAAKMSVQDRAAFLEELADLTRERQQVADLFTAASAAGAQLGAAHAALVASAQDKSLSSTEFIAALSKLTGTVATLTELSSALRSSSTLTVGD